MFNKNPYSEDKLLLELENQEVAREVYEPLVRKLGGVWNKTLNGWIFEIRLEPKVDEFIRKQNIILAEKQNKEYYTKFSDEPKIWNTPSSSNSSHRSNSGLDEAFDLIQELIDRVSDLEKIVEEHSRKLRR
jgi:hypothetical protein